LRLFAFQKPSQNTLFVFSLGMVFMGAREYRVIGFCAPGEVFDLDLV
jgi:hypothetical protein